MRRWLTCCVLLATLGCGGGTPAGPKRGQAMTDFRVVITEESIACEHPRRPRESIRWADIRRIRYATTSDGPFLPDEWFLFEGEGGASGCSVPAEAVGFERVWDEIKRRFPGFDYEPIIKSGTDDAVWIVWEKKR